MSDGGGGNTPPPVTTNGGSTWAPTATTLTSVGIPTPQFGSNKPPKYDDVRGFDLYKAMLQSYPMQRGAWGIIDGSDELGANPSAADTQLFQAKNALARDALLRGVPVKDATRICTLPSDREMWIVFEQEKTKRAFSNALFLRKKLYTYTYKQGMGMDKFLDKMEHMRRQLRNMNDEITDSDMVKLILQGVAFEYRGVVRMFDKEVRDGNIPLLQDVLNTLRSEAEIDKQHSSTSNKSGNTMEEAKIMQMKQQQQVSGAKGKRHWKQNRKPKSFKKFKNKNGEAGETRTCYFCQKPGHLKRNCDEYRIKKDQNETEVSWKRWRQEGDTNVLSKVEWCWWR